jgi:methanogenic corrinoid protein MtbC1
VQSAERISDVTALRTVGETVLRQRTEIAKTLVSMEFARQPQLERRLGDSARVISLHDSQFHLSYLAAALFADNPELFVDAVGWAKVALTRRGWSTDELAAKLGCLCDALNFELPQESAEIAVGFVRDAIERLPQLPDEVPSFIDASHRHALLARLYLKALVEGDRKAARLLILSALEDGISVRDIYLNVLQPVLYEVGRLWQIDEISVAREHFCTAATQLIMSLLQRHADPEQEPDGRTIVTTCVAGDQHEIGVRMVADFFEMAGWNSYYLGANTPTDSVIDEVIERKADVLGVSATMIYHIPAVADLIQAVRRAPECKQVKILVGGYPFRRDCRLWLAVGADGEARDAEAAVDRACTLFERAAG